MKKLIVTLALGLSACAGPQAAVRSHAAAEMGCDASKLSLTQPYPNANLFMVDGCGETGRYAVGCNIFGFCAEAQGQVVSTLIRKQAAFDLKCDAPGLALQALNADTFGVRGCGRQASYLLVCDSGPCKAVQNTQAQ